MKRVFGPTSVISSTAQTVSTSHDLDLNAMGADQLAIQVIYTDATPSAATFDAAVYEVQTLTFDTKANTTHQDLVIVSDAAGLTYAIALTKPVAAVSTLTFPAVAAATAGDYIVITDTNGDTWAAALNKSGADPAPTGAIYTAIPAGRKVNVDISGGTDAASVAALVETALNALTGFTALITTDDTAADGTMTLTHAAKAPVAVPVPHDESDAGAGSISAASTTTGVASTAPSGPLWTAVDASRKGLADISSDTTAAQVAARAETALNALTGFTAAITSDDTAADGTMTLTQTSYGPTTDPVPKNAAESGAGSISGVQSTGGVSAEIDLATDVITIPSHGFTTGLKGQLTTTGGLPAGLSLATNYFVIYVSASTIKLASSLANAEAGTAIDITTHGTGVHTFTPTALGGATVKLQGSNDETNYDDLASQSVTISAAGNELFHVSNPAYDYLRILFTPSAGAVGLTVKVVGKRTSFSAE